jgi:RNA polymerase sigma factor (sigma-70 family)
MDATPTLTADDLLTHAAWIRQLAAALTNDAATANDLAQDTWVAALRNPPAADMPPRPWLSRVMMNLARSRHRREERLRHRERAAAKVEGVPGSDDVAGEVELHRALADALAQLEEPTRSTIVRRFFHDQTSAEIARTDGIPESTVRNRLKRGLDAMKRSLDAKYGARDTWVALAIPIGVHMTPKAVAGMTWIGKTLVALLVVGVGAVGLRVYHNLNQSRWWTDDRGGAHEGPPPPLATTVPSIVIDWQRGPQPMIVYPYIKERDMLPMAEVEVHVVGEVLTIGDRSYRPVHAGDVVTVTDKDVSINGVRVEPLR